MHPRALGFTKRPDGHWRHYTERDDGTMSDTNDETTPGDGGKPLAMSEFTKQEVWDTLMNVIERQNGARDSERNELVERLQGQNEELHGTLTSIIRGGAESIKSMSDASSTMLRRRRDEISLSFPVGDSEFRFSCSLDSLSDDDVRFALEGGLALLKTVGASQAEALQNPDGIQPTTQTEEGS